MKSTELKKPMRNKGEGNGKPTSARLKRATIFSLEMADCSACRNFNGPARWPDKQGVSHCNFNGVSLAIQLDHAGYRRGLWFCRGFKNKKRRSLAALFQQACRQLEPDVLYTFSGENNYLIEHRMADLPRMKRNGNAT